MRESNSIVAKRDVVPAAQKRESQTISHCLAICTVALAELLLRRRALPRKTL